MIEDLSQISFDEILHGIKRGITLLHKELEYYQTQTPEVALKNLRRVTALIGDKPISPPKILSELYRQQWQDFMDGKRNSLDRKPIRYFCSEPNIALHPKFLDYIIKPGIILSAQAIHALVRSCHMKWTDGLLNNEALSKIRGFVKDYDGPNRIVRKWKENIGHVLYADATSKFAQEILGRKEALDKLFQEWGIDAQSGFVEDAVNNACISCRKMMGYNNNHNNYYLKELLAWDRWNESLLRSEIEAAILESNIVAIQKKFQAFVLGHEKLGDPRQPKNINWRSIKEEAIDRFTSWLSRRDIIFFFQHVLQRGQDPHGRKEFWLKYVPSLKISRPLLCDSDWYPLRGQLQTDKIDFGRLNGNSSAFILDFGSIVVVEFSKVGGACFIYARERFRMIVPDLFENKYFDFSTLKRRDIAMERIVHRQGWQDNATAVLARNGVR